MAGEQKQYLGDLLGEFIASKTYKTLPPETIARAKEYVLDVIGCAIAASKEPQGSILTDVLKEMGGNEQSSVIARGFKTSEMNAAMINGAFGHTFDFDDDHREGTQHPSVAVFPAIFAVGENRGTNGKEFLRSFVLGLEMMIRSGESLLGKSYYQGFHPTGTVGVFGAAAGTAALMGLDAIRTTYALGIAGSFSSGTLEGYTTGAWQKPLQAGHPAMMGVLAASLAEKNFIGARSMFDGTNSIIRSLSYRDQYDLGRFTVNLGKKWEMMDTSIKVHACCRFSGPVADCALDLYKQGVRAKDVKGVHAKVGDYTIKQLCYPTELKIRPLTHVDAQFSLPWAISVGICRNRTSIDEFRDESLHDPELLDFAKKVTWELDPAAEAMYPKAYPATVIAELKDGRKFEAHVDYPKGDPENPVTHEEIVAKFNLLTANFLSVAKRKKIVETIGHLDELKSIAELADLVR